jgi:brefeldin A-inhibited guanine nucleotide-exchange protein
VELEEESQQRNIIAWRPVVVDVIEGYTNFPQEGFEKYVEVFYPLGVELLNRDLGGEVRVALQGLLRRVGEVKLGLTGMGIGIGIGRAETPVSPMAYSFSSRRSSRKD